MKTTNYYRPEILSKAIFAFCMLFIALFSSCDKDEEGNNGYFELNDNTSSVEIAAAGATQSYTFRSSGNWKVEPVRKENWLKIEPAQGNGDGTFTVKVAKNTASDARSMTLFFSVDGKLQNSVLKIEQKAATDNAGETDSYLSFDGDPTSIDAGLESITNNYVLRATGAWKIQFADEDVDWLTVSPMEGTGDSPVTITVAKNFDVKRNTSLLFFLDEVQQSFELPVNQEGIIPQISGDVVFSEDFNWLTYGSRIFNNVTGETRIGQWTAADLAKGWTSTINTTQDGGNYASIYGRPGFVKLGRTNYGGDLISPKLEDVQGTKNLVVTFKAVRYAAGDHYLLTVGVNGPGTVDVSSYDVMNIASPNSTLEGCDAAWEAPEAIRSFVITGATADTQIWFMGGAFDQRASSGWPKTVNRIFIDDIVVKVQ